jgi:ArsR family metal-binding transcriptional regulator
MHALEFQKMKDEILKRHHGNKPLKQKEIKPMFTFNYVPTTNNKI